MRLETIGTPKNRSSSPHGGNSAFYTDDLPVGKDFKLVIARGAGVNPPRRSTVKLFGLDRYLCAYLDAGVRYRIEAGNFNRAGTTSVRR